MKKMVAIILAVAICVSALVLPASAEETDLLDEKFREVTKSLDSGYGEYGSLEAYMVARANRAVFEEAFEDPWDHNEEELVLSAEEYEAVMNRYFVVTQERLAKVRAEGYAGRLTYNAEDNTYTVRHPLGFGGALPERSYMGYVATSTGFDVFYGVTNYAFLRDALPEGTDAGAYAESLGNPAVIEYQGKQYQNGPDGYYCVESVEKHGMKYSLVMDNDNARISSVSEFTEADCPESFEKRPEVDEDLLSIMADIKDLVEKYGPEIPDEVKNGTDKGTTGDYKAGAGSYYVAIGDDTAYEAEGYVKLLAEKLGLKDRYENLAKKGMLIDEVDQAFLEENREDIQKADLITVGFSLNSFAAVAVDEVLKNKSEEESYMQWDRYIPQEGVQEVEAVLERMEEYLQGTGMTGNIPILNIPKTDALVVAAESLAFGTLAYTYELPRLIEDIREINPTAQIVIVGMDNPMENSGVMLSSGEKMEVGIYVDQLINNMDDASQTVAIEKENTAFVSAPHAANEYDNNSELTENKLIISYIGSVKAQVKPNADGHAYIRDQILQAMRKKGDVNCDGKADYSDALLILRASIGLETLTEGDLLFADVTGDGKADYSDALKILRASIGLEDLDAPTQEHQHSWKDATCTEPKKCETCGTTEGEAKGHDWEEATAEKPKTCKVCGITEGGVKEHDWQEATCTAPKTCKTCGATEGEAKGHDWMDATCDAPKTCKICGTTEGEAKEHDWMEATCASPKKCRSCGVTEGTAMEHDWQEATCTSAKHCRLCGQKDGKALGHELGEDGLCTRCGAVPATTVNLPEAGKTVTFYDAGDTVIRSWELNSITAEQIGVDPDGDLTYQITLTGTCTYNVAGESASEAMWIEYKLYDAEGIVIKSNTTQSTKVAVGEKFQKEIMLYDLKPGEIYDFSLVDVR